jgi:phenylalanyl-tRNA synthetase beta chain
MLGASREGRAGAPGTPTLALRRARWKRVIGLDVPVHEAARQLEALEFGVARAGDDILRVSVPSWRPDVTLEDDLVEEVARGHGYDRIPEAPLETRGLYARRSAREQVMARARSVMLARGFAEAWCTSLVTGREAVECARLLGADPARLLRLSNPVSREGEVLRPNLVPGLLRALAHNLRQGVQAVRLFEIGAGYLAAGEGLPEEPLMLAAAACGPRWAHAHDATQSPLDFDDAKGLWEAWLDEMGVDTTEWRAYSGDGWKPGASAEVASGTSRIAWAGTLARGWLRGWDIEVDVHLFVALLDPLAAVPGRAARVKVPPRFPAVSRDLAFFVPRPVTHDRLVRAVREAAGERLARIELFDVYTGPGTPEGMKSLAFALQFQDPEQTLQDREVQTIQDRIVAAVANQCGGRLRER